MEGAWYNLSEPHHNSLLRRVYNRHQNLRVFRLKRKRLICVVQTPSFVLTQSVEPASLNEDVFGRVTSDVMVCDALCCPLLAVICCACAVQFCDVL
jgi:hypothetical protein